MDVGSGYYEVAPSAGRKGGAIGARVRGRAASACRETSDTWNAAHLSLADPPGKGAEGPGWLRDPCQGSERRFQEAGNEERRERGGPQQERAAPAGARHVGIIADSRVSTVGHSAAALP